MCLSASKTKYFEDQVCASKVKLCASVPRKQSTLKTKFVHRRSKLCASVPQTKYFEDQVCASKVEVVCLSASKTKYFEDQVCASKVKLCASVPRKQSTLKTKFVHQSALKTSCMYNFFTKLLVTAICLYKLRSLSQLFATKPLVYDIRLLDTFQ